MTTLNTIRFLLLLQKKNGGRFEVISVDEIQKLAEKAVNRNTVKATKTWMKLWK